MNTIRQGIAIDSAPLQSNTYFHRRLVQALGFHFMEAIVLFLCILAGEFLLYQINDVPIDLKPLLVLIPAWWVGAWITHLAPGWGMGLVEDLRRVELLLLTLFGFSLLSFFIQAEWIGNLSRISFLTAYLLASVMMPLGRALVRQILFLANQWGIPVAIYGSHKTIVPVINALEKDRGTGFVPKYIFSDEHRLGEAVSGVPVLGKRNNYTTRALAAVVALPHLDNKELIHLLEGPLSSYRTVLLVPDLQDAPSLWVKPCDLQGMLALQICRNLLDPIALYSKIWIERIVVLLTMPIWAPLCVLIMLVVWLQDFHSPVFSQVRLGRDNVPFKAYKLRTMVPDADRALMRSLENNPELRAEWNAHYKLKKDPRITPIGNLLRKTSLDELPQLWCVLAGKMALVGPRPLPEYHHNALNDRTQHLRAKVLPGITGLWQVSGRSECGTEGMDRWDTYYVTNWSIWLDLAIIFRTAHVVFFGHGAY